MSCGTGKCRGSCRGSFGVQHIARIHALLMGLVFWCPPIPLTSREQWAHKKVTEMHIHLETLRQRF